MLVPLLSEGQMIVHRGLFLWTNASTRGKFLQTAMLYVTVSLRNGNYENYELMHYFRIAYIPCAGLGLLYIMCHL